MNQLSTPIHRVAVIGAGAWGTTLARHLANKGLTVHLWAYESEVVETIRTHGENTLFLPGVRLPDRLRSSTDIQEVVQDAELLVLGVPSHAMRVVCSRLGSMLSEPRPVVIASKGIEEGSHHFMSQLLCEVLPPSWHSWLTVLAGPSFASEVCQEKPTTVVLAGKDSQLVTSLQTVFMTPQFRVYTSTDVLGAQIGGALKNVMAIAAGVVDGLDLGYNARAALITRGLTEMVRIATALGADMRTLYGLSGLGDLVLTCTGPLSRNYSVGQKLGAGQSLPEILQTTKTVAEGIRTTRAVVGLANQLSIDMPIAQSVYGILFEERDPQEAVSSLMVRAAKRESDSTTLSTFPSSS
ncbi:MAG: NAD(P)H-dependent glycerol-3-phosphate dehydrogenase [Nitrospirales bacterium]|nr:NAD(P)H-dependent glycerol-3-phosphate dehydrogenase [Nitrospirales bacterium]